MGYEAALAHYQRFDFQDGPWTRPVYRRGAGPAVIVIHEMPGLHPLVIRFADRVAAAGMTVFMPSLFGDPGRPVSVPYVLGSSTGCARWPGRSTRNAAVAAWGPSACASRAVSRSR